MKLWLSRRRSGRYILSALRPIYAQVSGQPTDHDLYFAPGEPVGVNDLCSFQITKLFGVSLNRWESIEVELTGCVLPGGDLVTKDDHELHLQPESAG